MTRSLYFTKGNRGQKGQGQNAKQRWRRAWIPSLCLICSFTYSSNKCQAPSLVLDPALSHGGKTPTLWSSCPWEPTRGPFHHTAMTVCCPVLSDGPAEVCLLDGVHDHFLSQCLTAW